MYRTKVLPDFALPDLSGTLEGVPWQPPSNLVAVLWAGPLSFRRGGIWARLLAERPWFQILFHTTPGDAEALVPPSLRSRTVLAKGHLSEESDQVVAVLVREGQVVLAMQDSPNEEAWEAFELKMNEFGLG